MIYAWKPGSRFGKADAASVATEIQGLGEATPETIVKKAKAKTSAMHVCFDWDDETAARKWRLEVAGHIVRAIVKYDEPKDDDEPQHIIRAFECVRVENDNAYIPIENALTNEQWRGEVFGNIHDSIFALEKKIESYEYHFPSLSKLKDGLRKTRKSIASG